jgi:hypothetical protein
MMDKPGLIHLDDIWPISTRKNLDDFAPMAHVQTFHDAHVLPDLVA